MAKQINAVGVIFENQMGEILILLRHKQDPEGGTWGLVGGKIEAGESKESTALREVKEEIGHDIDLNKLIFLKSYHWNRDNEEIIFEVFKLKVENDEVSPDLEKNEHTEYQWISPKEAFNRKDLMVGLYPILKDHYSV